MTDRSVDAVPPGIHTITPHIVVRDAARDDYRWSSLLLGIVKSLPFQMQKARAADETGRVATTVAERR